MQVIIDANRRVCALGGKELSPRDDQTALEAAFTVEEFAAIDATCAEGEGVHLDEKGLPVKRALAGGVDPLRTLRRGMKAAVGNWATLTAAQKSDAMRDCVAFVLRLTADMD